MQSHSGNNKEKHDHLPPPWLLINDGSQKQKQYFYNISENRFYPARIPEICDTTIIASSHGWLVLAGPKTEDCCIWNPATLDKIELPLNYSSLYNKCVLSKSPSEPDCNVVVYSTTGCHRTFLRIGRLEDDYTVFSLEYLGEEELYLMAAASFQGKIYCLVNPGFRFVTLHHLEGGTVEYRPILNGDGQPLNIDGILPKWASYTDNHLIESPCGKELLLVHKLLLSGTLHDNLDFRVFQVDADKKECIELHDIGQRAIFLSYGGGGFCCNSSAVIKPNSIYYTVPNRGNRNSKNVYVYDLDVRGVTPLLSCRAARRTQSVCY